MSTVAVAASHDPALFRRTLELFPAGAYTCDPEGLITWFNQRAVELWGRQPRLNDPVDRYCGSFRLMSAHSLPIDHDACWMALALRNRRDYHGQEIIIERGDGSRITALAYATPLLDADGEVLGAVNILINISERKRMEQLLAEANRANDFYRATLAEAMREEMRPMHEALAELEVQCSAAASGASRVEILKRQLSQLSTLVDELLDVRGKSLNNPA